MYTETFSQMKKHLGQLDKWLGTAGEYAKSKACDPNVFVGLRLAPDQFPLARQVQICCDSAKLAASFLSGKPAESHPDTEQTLEELQARVRSTIGYLDGFSAQDFDGAATLEIRCPARAGCLPVLRFPGRETVSG